MPDFPTPPGGGATAAQVWAYGTRGLTGDAANAIRDAILSDATRIPGANVDAQVSLVKAKTDNLPASPAPAAEYDTELDAPVSSRSPSSEYDSVLATLAAYVDELETRLSVTRAGNLDKIQDLIEEAVGTLTATGAEDTIKEITAIVNKLHCFVDLTAMQAGDTIVVRQYMKIKAAGTFILYAEETYSDVQALPMLYVVTKPAKDGIRITLEQTGGTNRDYDWQTFQELAA